MPADLLNPIFTDADAARAHLEAIRWPTGAWCPHCGEMGNAHRMEGASHAPGLHYCRGCRKKFSVTVGTIFERSHIPLNKWMLAFHLMSGSKKGISAHQLHRHLGITYKSAWFMAHRVRECMKAGEFTPPIGGEGKTVEVDETYIGKKPGALKKGAKNKNTVIGLVERGATIRLFHVANATLAEVRPIVEKNVAPKSTLSTDEATVYDALGDAFVAHLKVKHGDGEYVRGDAHTNTIEGAFGVFKRGMRGTYQHCAEHHLHRYLSEFEFRYNNRAKLKVTDAQRALTAIKGAEGRRLTYRQPH